MVTDEKSDEWFLSFKTLDGRTHWLTKAETENVIEVIRTLDRWDREAKARAAGPAEAVDR